LRLEAIAEWSKATSLAGDKELSEILQDVKSEDDYADAVEAICATRLKRLNARIDRGEFVPAVFIARAYIRLGDIEQAFRWLEEAGQERTAYSLLMNIDPFYDGLREDQRFVAILKSMNLG